MDLFARILRLEALVEQLFARIYLLERRIAGIEQQNQQRFNNQ